MNGYSSGFVNACYFYVIVSVASAFVLTCKLLVCWHSSQSTGLWLGSPLWDCMRDRNENLVPALKAKGGGNVKFRFIVFNFESGSPGRSLRQSRSTQQ